MPIADSKYHWLFLCLYLFVLLFMIVAFQIRWSLRTKYKMVFAKYWSKVVGKNSLRWSISGFCWGCNTIFNIQTQSAISSVLLTFHPFIVLLACFMERCTFAYSNYSQVQSFSLTLVRAFQLISTAAGSGPSVTRLICQDVNNSTFLLIQITRITSWDWKQTTGYLPQELECIVYPL